MIHTVKGFGTVNKAVIDIFLELSCLVKEKAYRQQERNKIAFVYRWHDHLCKNSKRVSKTLLELINHNRKAAGYQVNQWKLTDFLCTNCEQMELKSMELFTLVPQKILKYKSNKLCTRSIWGKVQNFDEQINKRNKQMEAKYMLMEKKTILLRGQNFSIWSIYPMQYQVKFQQVILCTSTMAIHWRKDNLFNKWYWNNWASKSKKYISRHRSYPLHKT